MPVRSLLSIPAGARLFALVALAPLIAFNRDYPTILSALLIGAVWTGATFVGSLPGFHPGLAVMVEASLVALLVGMSTQSTGILIPALVIPLFIAGIYLGVRGTLQALAAESAVLIVTVGVDPDVHA